MTGTQFERFARQHLLPDLARVEVRRRLLFQAPVGWLLCGVYVDSSGFARDTFVLHAFVQPLTVPVDHLTLSFGRRLGEAGGEWLTYSPHSAPELAPRCVKLIQTQAVPLWSGVGCPASFASSAHELCGNRRDIHLLEAVGHCLAIERQPGKALDVLGMLLAQLDHVPDRLPYMEQMRSRATRLLDLLESNESGARAQLISWRSETLSALRIEGASLPLGE